MNKLIKDILTFGSVVFLSCTPVKNNQIKEQNTLEELLAPYTISEKEFKKKYKPEENSYCNMVKGPEPYAIKYDDGENVLMAIWEFKCTSEKETKKRYVVKLIEGRIIHGDYEITEKEVYFSGKLTPEQNIYFEENILNTGKSYFKFDINRDGNIDFILYGDSEIFPLPTNLNHIAVTINNNF